MVAPPVVTPKDKLLSLLIGGLRPADATLTNSVNEELTRLEAENPTPNPARDALLVLWVVSCLALLVWPVYARFGSSIEPFVFGLPWSLAWVVACVGLTFLAVLAYHLSGDDERG